MCYTLTIDADGADAIAFSGYRYCWSKALERLLGGDLEGTHELAEHEAWELNDAFEKDLEGDHSYFPLLAHDSVLAENLFSLIEEIV